MISTKISGLLRKAETEIVSAKKQHFHSFVEDRLIDSLDSLIDAVKALLREAKSK